MSVSPPQASIGVETPPPRAERLLERLATMTAICCALVVVLLIVDAQFPGLGRLHALLRTARQTGAAGIMLGTAMVALTGEVAWLALAHARRPSATPSATRRPRARRLWLPTQDVELSPSARIGAAARDRQGTIVPLLAGFTCALVWLLRPGPSAPAPADAMIVAAILLILGFLALIAERSVAALRATSVVEADALRALVLLPALALPIAAAVTALIGVGIDGAAWVASGVIAMTGLVALELALRALGRWFLPPPLPAAARAAVTSLFAAMLAGACGGGGIAAPLRTQLGLDFSRSWALAYLRGAAMPALVLTALLCWTLTGLTAIGIDARGIYERFGAPVAVLGPGLHLVLPWPLGRLRRVEFGTVHSLAIGGDTTAVEHFAAEAPPPPSADRLWDQTHVGEVAFVIASDDRVSDDRVSDDRASRDRASRGPTGAAATRAGFQTINADVRILWRIGLTDADAERAAYGTADPAASVAAAVGRTLSAFFATRTLDTLLGTRRETMAETLRAAIAADLAPLAEGIDIVGVVVEAVHPPAGAAAAYHGVQAAAITARTSIAEQRGRAAGTISAAQQDAHQITTRAEAAARETDTAAEVEGIRFAADRAADAAGGAAFRLERYLASLATALARSPLTIVDNRLDATSAPLLDLRPLAGPAAPVEDPD